MSSLKVSSSMAGIFQKYFRFGMPENHGGKTNVCLFVLFCFVCLYWWPLHSGARVNERIARRGEGPDSEEIMVAGAEVFEQGSG